MSTSQLEKLKDEVTVPEGVTVTKTKHMLSFVGPLGKTFKSFRSIPVDIEIVENKITLKAQGERKRDYGMDFMVQLGNVRVKKGTRSLDGRP